MFIMKKSTKKEENQSIFMAVIGVLVFIMICFWSVDNTPRIYCLDTQTNNFEPTTSLDEDNIVYAIVAYAKDVDGEDIRVCYSLDEQGEIYLETPMNINKLILPYEGFEAYIELHSGYSANEN